MVSKHGLFINHQVIVTNNWYSLMYNYFQHDHAYCRLGFFFSPLVPAVVLLTSFTLFYVKKVTHNFSVMATYNRQILLKNYIFLLLFVKTVQSDVQLGAGQERSDKDCKKQLSPPFPDAGHPRLLPHTCSRGHRHVSTKFNVTGESICYRILQLIPYQKGAGYPVISVKLIVL